jgi:acyl dehydratase
MVQNVKTLGGQRYRETFGRYYEDFAVGDTYEHRPGRTITETDNTWFTLLTNNPHPVHYNADYAARTEFGRPLVVSTLTLAMQGEAVRTFSRGDTFLPPDITACGRTPRGHPAGLREA